MGPPHVKSKISIIYRRLMTQKQLRPCKCITTLSYIRSTTLEWKRTMSYSPNSKCTYDLIEDEDQLSSVQAARRVYEDRTEGSQLP